ncbi:uncharacterized protein LOC126935852 isoform X2 [Macaca thibetana thibetana]|uniref:uncharacterized protein LOC126935852 isoform X2 n=1 Tax=Macaca thibetana thibetana TaxID=257877 RepID=UPI0021BCBD73|nr:uncharacterized protein LOC126935852 isoform X2 [Macaca thibetana thibetana]XP_050613896.1 uncharacterized protein LOC126935852 isoform X2 [Macaca thibetana thibetana]
MVHTQVQGTLWQSAGHPLLGKDTSCIKETRVSGVRRPKAGPRGEPSYGRRRNLKVWVQSLRSCTGSTRGHSRWTGSSRVCSNWTGSRMTHSLRRSSRACSSWTGSRMTHSLKSKSRACSNCIGSSHKNHSHPWSPHRSHSWSRNRSTPSSLSLSGCCLHSSWRLCYLHRCCGFPVLLVCKPLSGDSTALCFSHTRSQSQRKTWCHWWEENNQNDLRRTPVLCRSREENRRRVIRFSTRSSSKEEVATFRKVYEQGCWCCLQCHESNRTMSNPRREMLRSPSTGDHPVHDNPT